MKTNLKFLLVSLILAFTSCEKTELIENESNTTLSKATNPPQGIGYYDVKSWNLNNGIINSSCTKNILVFPSWDRYNQVIEYLDQESDSYYNAFMSSQPLNQTELEYEAAVTAANYDEDRKLEQMENFFQFCSLRKKLNLLEDTWLDTLDDGDWDLSNDPDNHFIDDYTERTLLNEQVEVIIGPTDSKRTKFTLYKFTGNGEFYTIALTTVSSTNNTIVNTGAISALQQINNGTYTPNSSPFVAFVKEDIQSDCKSNIVFADDYTNSSNTSRFIAKSVLKRSIGTNCNNNPCTSIFPSKIKAITRGFHKKNGKWKKKRTWIVAEISGSTSGSNANPLLDCLSPFDCRDYTNKKKRRVKAKVTSGTYIPIQGTPARFDFGVNINNNVYTRHSQDVYVIEHNLNNL